MRRRAIEGLIALVLIAAPALAAPVPAPGLLVETLPHGLKVPSGAAADGNSLVLTDLATGNVVRLAAGGRSTVIQSGLPTGRDVMGQPTGPYKVQIHDGRLFVAQGWQDVNRGETPIDHAILEMTPGGQPKVVSNDFWNPYDFTRDGDGWLVIDAGRNALMRLGDDGKVAPVFTFPQIKVRKAAFSKLSPTEFKGETVQEVDAVPTGLALSGDRAYIALFGGFPFVEGAGSVVSVAKGGGDDRARIEIRSLNTPIAVAFDAEGRLLVLEMGLFELEKGFLPESGRLLRYDLKGGERTVLLSGLSMPVTVLPLPGDQTVVVQMAGPILRLRPAH